MDGASALGMLTRIGKQSGEEPAQRIRLYVNLARQLAVAPDVSARERRDAARTVRRYFTHALPRDLADAHDVRRLVLLCHVLERDPLHPRARAELATLAVRLDAAVAQYAALRGRHPDQRPRATITTAAK